MEIAKNWIYRAKIFEQGAPEYLTDFLSRKLKPTTEPLTRSSADTSLLIAHIGKNRIGDKSFCVTALALWNSLPRNTREASTLSSFKKVLKSHLYPSYWLFCIYMLLYCMALWSCLERRLLNICMYIKTDFLNRFLVKLPF